MKTRMTRQLRTVLSVAAAAGLLATLLTAENATAKRRRKKVPAPAAADAPAADAPAGEDGPLRRSNTIEFDARLVQGETATAGAVFLFQRAPRPLPPLVTIGPRTLQRIVWPVLGEKAADRAVQKFNAKKPGRIKRAPVAEDAQP